MPNGFYSLSYVKLTDVTPYARNAREHSKEQVEQIINSIREFGFTSPILIDAGNVLIAGHGRLAAAREMGMTELPAIVIEGLSETQKQALRLADNKLALNASWDDDLLRAELMDLRDVGFDLGLTGFGEMELAGLFADMSPGLTDPDEVPEPPAEPVTQPGDVWLLGRHRLVCGDCTEVLPTLTGIDAVVTDPPYGLGKKMSGGTWGKAAKYRDMRNWDVAPSREVLDALLIYAEVILWGGHYFALDPSRCWLVWDKLRDVATMADCELAWTNFDRPTKKFSGRGDFNSTGHPTQKPVALIQWCLGFVKAQIILDPFVGSGTTIIAAEMTGRACHAIEISPAYCDVTILRWQAFTGQTATRPDGQAFETERRHTVHAD